jgi:adenylate cyclase
MYRKFKTSAITAFLLVLIGVALHLTPFGRNLEEHFDLNILFQLRGQRPVPPGVVIVSLDQESIEQLALPSNPVKWPRSLYASLTRNLINSGAVVIVFDVFFAEPTSDGDDQDLAEAFADAGNVLVCGHLKRELIPVPGGESASGTLYVEKIVPPIQRIADTAAAFAPYPLPKVPMRVSQIWRFKTEAGCMPTLPFLAFQFFSLDMYKDFILLLESVSPTHSELFPPDPEAIRAGGSIAWFTATLRAVFEEKPGIGEGMLEKLHGRDALAGDLGKAKQFGALVNAYTEPDSVFLNFYGPPGSIATIPFHRVLQAGGENSNLPEIKGKVVFVGLSELLRPENRDGFHTVFSKPDGIDLSGVEIAATAFANLLEDQPVRPARSAIFVGIIFLCGLVLGCVCCILPPILTVLGIAGSALIYLYTATTLFAEAGTWIPVAVPFAVQAPLALCCGFLWHHAGTKKERAQIKKAFGLFLPDRVIDQIIIDMKAARDIAHANQTVFGVVLCSDGAQYTSLSENMSPKELSIFLNRYYEAIFHPVRAHKGTISDIIGDSMLAVWANAHPDTSLKQYACRAAVDIMKAVDDFNKNSGRYKLHTRIGLHYGELVLGNVGGFGHFEYRPVGDVVNTASRIEGLNKYFGTRMLASKEIMDECSGFLTRELGVFQVYGKTKPVTIFELICPIEDADEKDEHLSAIFSEALRSFRRHSWDRAEALFLEYLSIAGEDEAAQHYLKECANYREYPPDESWDGMVYYNRK